MITPKKSLGQHWLNDQESLDAIVNVSNILPNETVLEIGPGLGALTQKLLDKGAIVKAVELDENLGADLSKNVTDPAGKLSVINQDILKFDFGTLPKNYKVVANIPYYLTSNLLRLLSRA